MECDQLESSDIRNSGTGNPIIKICMWVGYMELSIGDTAKVNMSREN